MLKTDSIQLFRDTVSTYLPEYVDATIEDVKKDLFDLLAIDVIVGLTTTPDTSQESLKIRLATNKISGEEIIDAYFSALALLYIENPQTKDELVLRLLDGNQKNFNSYVEEGLLVKEAFQRLERKEKKEYLKNLEVQLEVEELQVAFTRLDRKQKKEELSRIDEINNQVAASNNNEEDSPAKKFTFRTIMRIAASVIVLSIPAGLLYLFLTGNHNSANKKVDNKETSKKTAANKPPSNKTVAEKTTSNKTLAEKTASNKTLAEKTTSNKTLAEKTAVAVKAAAKVVILEDFGSYSLKMHLPAVTLTQGTKQVIPTPESQGFGNSEGEVIIEIKNYEAQLTYLETKRKKLQAEISNLESLSFKHKKSTLDSLRTGVFNIDALKKEIQLKEGTYTFKDKKLTLVSVKKKDLQKMKVFNFNDEGTDQFYLKMESDYYLLAEPNGNLKRLADRNIINSLNCKDLE
jgi:hypothetical protein